MESFKTPAIINQAKENNWLHVFFTVSPVTSIILRMIVEKYSIPKEKIIVFSFRDTDTKIIDFKVHNIKVKKHDRYLEKILWDSPTGRKIIKNIVGEKFIVYASWAFREVEWVINSKSCLGHIYIEEGQQSYLNITEFNPKEVSFYNRFKKNWKNRFSEKDDEGYYFRSDSKAYIGISQKVFPAVDSNKRFILNNINDVKKYYKPKLLGVKNIGVTCALRRSNEENWDKMLRKLIKFLPNESIIKAHPSFFTLKEVKDKFLVKYNIVSNGKIPLCSNNVILEMEMLFEKKNIIGSKTALSIYAKQFGSTFKLIKLY
jgi:hypothetical protein